MKPRNKKPHGWHAEDIKAAIRKQGLSLAELSRRNGFHADAVRLALRGAWMSRAVDGVIASFIGVAPSVLWPDRYARGGARRG